MYDTLMRVFRKKAYFDLFVFFATPIIWVFNLCALFILVATIALVVNYYLYGEASILGQMARYYGW